MKNQKLTRKLTGSFLLIGILIFSNLIQAAETVWVFYNPDPPQHAFAAGDIKAVDLQRNLDYSSWHDHDQDALQDYIDMGGEGKPNCSGSRAQ